MLGDPDGFFLGVLNDVGLQRRGKIEKDIQRQDHNRGCGKKNQAFDEFKVKHLRPLASGNTFFSQSHKTAQNRPALAGAILPEKA